MDTQSQPLSSLPLPPSTLATLSKAGYETLEDLPPSDSANQLTDVLKIPLKASQTIYSSSQRPGSGDSLSVLPSTQSAAALMGSISRRKQRMFSTRCPPIDTLLNGGVPEGGIVELSGPPGSSKERILLNIILSCVKVGRSVLFVDCQSMCDPRSIDEHLKDVPTARRLVTYVKIGDLTEFLMFMNNLSSNTDKPFDMLAISCLTFPFQNAQISIAARNNLLEKIKQTLTKLSHTQNVTIAITSQLVTRLMNIDGTTGNFDSVGAKGIMVPQLGPAYLPSGKVFRLLVALDGAEPRTGFVRLLAPLKPGIPPEASFLRFDMRDEILEQ
ncbi:P-loop containing nucleoside triphosphate hydrolase protein [Lentinula edodes]|nr:P-loop containing nucleoside triphosphate hydrolase protein [Lentinula edodes]